MIPALFPLLLLLTVILPVSAAEPPAVQLVATGKDRAIVIVDGERLVLDRGERGGDGVQLVRADSGEAVLRINGKEIILRAGAVAAPVLQEAYTPPPAAPASITLWADRDGFFHADGKINGQPVRFLVDTGANTIALSSEQADRLKIDYEKGKPGFASTAAGIAPMKMVKLRQITVGGITAYNLEAGIIQGDHPRTPLLGAPFLEKVEMIRSGQRMELRKR